MQPVITVSLNRNAYQFERDAQQRLESYLDEANARLAGNPDRAEIVHDLEQAIADQCRKRMQNGQGVVTLLELEPALAEIGDVDAPPSESSADAKGREPGASLQQVSQGAMISGICNGIAAAAKLDVTLVRVIAVVLLFATGGAMILLYAVLMLLVPFAPIDSAAPPPRAVPAKCREWVQFLRAKLSALTG